MSVLRLSGTGLTLEDVRRAVTEAGLRIEIDPAAMERVLASRAVVERALATNEPVYGVNTGFGRLESTRIAPEGRIRLQHNLVRSHSCGVGPPLPAQDARLLVLLRIQSLVRGHSGVTPELVERLVAMWNAGLAPVVPEQGSVGASGDLAPLAHAALTLIGEGEVIDVDGERRPAAEALERAGLAPHYELREKEGLALLNGTQFSTGIGLLALARADRLLRYADLCAAVTLDALQYSVQPFRDAVHAARPHPGHGVTARTVRMLLEGSEILPSHAGPHKMQDPYSVRCAPQVHGACRDALSHVRDVLIREANSTTDNPLIFPADGSMVSAGNFHAEPVALVCDYMAIAAAELASISERRIENLVNPDLSGLTPFLAVEPGVQSGFMMAQVTAAALVSENKCLAHPASVDSIPTSANQEDHVSMAPIAARKARSIVRNTERVLCIELLCAAQALETRRPLRSGAGVEAAVAELRKHVAPLTEDRILAPDIEAVRSLMRTERMLSAAEAAAGPLVGLLPPA